MNHTYIVIIEGKKPTIEELDDLLSNIFNNMNANWQDEPAMIIDNRYYYNCVCNDIIQVDNINNVKDWFNDIKFSIIKP